MTWSDVDDHSLRRLLGVRLGRFRMYAPRQLGELRGAGTRSTEPVTFAMVTPVRNQANYVARSVRSVLDQDYRKLRYVVKDGASTDGTQSVIAQLADDRVQVVSEQDRGLAHALNKGFALVDGDVMAYINGDDFLLPGALHQVAAFFESHPEVDVLYGHRVIVDEQDREIGRWILPPHSDEVMKWDDYVPQETTFWRARAWHAAGARFDEDLRFAVDWDLWLRFLATGARFVRVPRYLAAFRVHSSQKTAVEMSGIGQEEIRMLRKRSTGRTSLIARAFATAPYLARHVVLSGADRLFDLYD